MADTKTQTFVKDVLENMPDGWLSITTHRLDIYDERSAKTEFLNKFDQLYRSNTSTSSALAELPTAYDYIRLGHPLSCVLEWTIARQNSLDPNFVISFSSKSMPLLAILRKNLLDGKKTRILYTDELPRSFDADVLRTVYGYTFEIEKIEHLSGFPTFDGSTVLVSEHHELSKTELTSGVDFYINLYTPLGSIILVNGERNERYISEIQHVRRRETVAMTPADCFTALQQLTGRSSVGSNPTGPEKNKASVLASIKAITKANHHAIVSSSGLSIQYAITMGLIHDALEHHKGKNIRIIVPPNSYGGTNDQARRVAACIDNVEVMDLPVDGGNDMVRSVELVLEKVAHENAIPFIIAEIPTNPRVEVPDLLKLKDVLSAQRKTATGAIAIAPVFILDQTFCPNVHFLGDHDMLATIRTISYTSGSKFPSGGQCTAGYCVANKKAEGLMDSIERHIQLCDNEATDLQYEILAKQLPSMLQRISAAYKNTREFVNYINATLPTAKVNFVSEQLAEQGFTPSVFSLDLPTKGATAEEKETYKRDLNHQLISLMITEIPQESKYCVSYGQLKGCYWTIPATSTQGTTKEGDKDHITRVSLSPDMDLEKHKKVFKKFVDGLEC